MACAFDAVCSVGKDAAVQKSLGLASVRFPRNTITHRGSLEEEDEEACQSSAEDEFEAGQGDPHKQALQELETEQKYRAEIVRLQEAPLSEMYFLRSASFPESLCCQVPNEQRRLVVSGSWFG